MGDRLAEIEARLSRATPWPWVWVGPLPKFTQFVGGVYDVTDDGLTPDAALIVSASRDLRDLLAVAKAARAVVQAKGRVDMRDPDTVAPLTAADDALAAALANLEGGAT